MEPQGGTVHKKSPPRGLPHGGRESSGALLSRARGPGTIGEGRLDFRVRNGNGYDPLSRTAETNFMAVKGNQPSAEARWVRAAHAARAEPLK